MAAMEAEVNLAAVQAAAEVQVAIQVMVALDSYGQAPIQLADLAVAVAADMC